ncbi:MAG: hypothetical protein ETSY1_02175 [Candidatus Entotheonella factor]|uniref:Fibronectin type-III domain-containing protein n=1 Tax=Entotheonella factor TaxID=1429438 RepID=W4LYL3_ENTF1|nr:MAG: hypothetical protein ETSY1_02175 [Candidatus Entotheonella factor]
MMSETRENYYLLLDLDPSIRDWSTIEAQIKAKQSQWSRDKSQSPSRARKLKAEDNLKHLPDMHRVLQDDSLRQQEAKAAEKQLKAQRREQLGDLRRDIRALSAKGHILESEVKKLVQKYQKKNLAEAAIRAEIAAKVVKDHADQNQSTVKPLDRDVAQNIDENLRAIGFTDLYAFLELSRKASVQHLRQKASEIDAELKQHAHKTGEISAKQALVGHCNVVFASEDTRQSYNQSMAESGLKAVTEMMNLIGSNVIDTQTYTALLEQGMNSGASEAQTRQHIFDVGKRRGIGVEVPSPMGETYRECGYCGAINTPDVKRCRSCGDPLIVDCPMPACRGQTPNTDSSCTVCGFPISDLPDIEQRLKRIQADVADGKLQRAKRSIQAMQRDYLPQHHGYPPAVALLNDIDQALQAQSDARAALQQLIQDNRMMAAERYFNTLPAELAGDPLIAQLKRRMDDALQLADATLQKAVKAEAQGKYDEAFAHGSQVLSLVQDHPDVEHLLGKYPPAPPTLLSEKADRIVSLEWEKSPSQGAIAYQIVRREGAVPSGPRDGQSLGTTSATRFDDDQVQAGVSYYYGVFAVRAGVASSGALTGPLMCVADVTNASAKAGDGRVTLSWEAPEKAVGFEVWRAESTAPRSRRQGIQIESVRRGGVTDEDVQNGVTYGYLIVALYEEEDGARRVSRGVSCQATPAIAARPLTGLAVARNGSQVDLTWTAPPVGTVEIYRTLKQPRWRVGEEVDIHTADQLGAKVPIISADTARDTLKDERLVYYLPVTVQGSVGVVGESCYITSVDDVSGLRGSLSGSHLLLKWTWPPNTKRCRVLMRTDGYAKGAEDPEAHQEEVLLAVYESKGGHYTSLPHGSTEVFVSVHAVVSAGERTFYAAGSSQGARQRVGVVNSPPDGTPHVTTLRYRIEAPPSWLKWLKTLSFKPEPQHRVIIQAEHPAILPELLVVTKSRFVPRHAADGEVVAILPAGTVVHPGKTVILAFSPGSLPQHTLARLFPADHADADWLKLEPNAPRMDIGS